jgi:hypothetical protein
MDSEALSQELKQNYIPRESGRWSALNMTYEARILQNGEVSVSDTYRIPILYGYSRIRIHRIS